MTHFASGGGRSLANRREPSHADWAFLRQFPSSHLEIEHYFRIARYMPPKYGTNQINHTKRLYL